MTPKNNKKFGKNHERKYLEDEMPAFDNHPDGSLDNSVNFSKEMGGQINYNPQVGYFFPSQLGHPGQIEFLKHDLNYNINWQYRCKGLPGSRP